MFGWWGFAGVHLRQWVIEALTSVPQLLLLPSATSFQLLLSYLQSFSGFELYSSSPRVTAWLQFSIA